MQYNPPLDATDPNAPYITLDKATGTPGSLVGGKPIEYPQREIVAAITAAGLTPSNADLTQLLQAIQIIAQRSAVDDVLSFFRCRYIFNGDILPSGVPMAGMVPVNGNQIANAIEIYPEAWAYLQTAEGQQLCISETEWQAAHSAVWYTLADGTPITWDNIGGVAKYVLDTTNGTIRVPDLRGMFAEAAGFDSLGVGGVHGDYSRQVRGYVGFFSSDGTQTVRPYDTSGCFYGGGPSGTVGSVNSTTTGGVPRYPYLYIDTARVGPAGVKNAPRAYGVLPCVYLGRPSA